MIKMAYTPPDEFARLYKLYTSDPDSLGKHLTVRMSALSDADPLLVMTGSDTVLFPAAGKAPHGGGFPKTPRGGIDVPGGSPLGPAHAQLIPRRDAASPARRLSA